LGPNLACGVLDISDSGVRLLLKQKLVILGEVEIIISGYGVAKSIKRLGDVRWQVEGADGLICVGIAFQKRLPYRDWQNLICAH
jgi:hypothetical protein